MIPTVPTTAQIAANIKAQVESSLGLASALLPRAFITVLSKALAAVAVVLYKFGGFTFLQMFVRTATYDEVTVNGVTLRPLQEWGRQVGVTDRKRATQAELTADVTVSSQTGSLSAGTQLVNRATGVVYIITAEVLLDAPVVSITVRASNDPNGEQGRGAAGNMNNGDELSFANPLANVAQTATVTGQITTGANGETVAAYRQRVLDRWQKPPQGGAYADYELWGEEAAGILNVYPYTSALPGQVDVYVEATVASSGSADGIPTPAQLEAVQAAIQLDENGLASRRPAGAFVNVYPITRTAFTVTVTGLAAPNLAQAETAVTDAVQEYFRGRAPYIEGLTVPPARDTISQTAVAGAVEDVLTALQGTFSGVTFRAVGTGFDLQFYVLGEGEAAKAEVVV